MVSTREQLKEMPKLMLLFVFIHFQGVVFDKIFYVLDLWACPSRTFISSIEVGAYNLRPNYVVISSVVLFSLLERIRRHSAVAACGNLFQAINKLIVNSFNWRHRLIKFQRRLAEVNSREQWQQERGIVGENLSSLHFDAICYPTKWCNLRVST